MDVFKYNCRYCNERKWQLLVLRSCVCSSWWTVMLRGAVFDGKDNESAVFRREKAAQWAVTGSVTATVNLTNIKKGKLGTTAISLSKVEYWCKTDAMRQESLRPKNYFRGNYVASTTIVLLHFPLIAMRLSSPFVWDDEGTAFVGVRTCACQNRILWVRDTNLIPVRILSLPNAMMGRGISPRQQYHLVWTEASLVEAIPSYIPNVCWECQLDFWSLQ